MISAPHRAFVQFGYTPEDARQYVQLVIDHRMYAEQPSVLLEWLFADTVSISDDGKTYFFERSFGNRDSDPKTIFKITKAELQKIFN